MKKNRPTPPSPQNRHKLVAFYLAHPEYSKSQGMLKRVVLDNGRAEDLRPKNKKQHQLESAK